MRKHKHHIIPKHAGGTDDPSNIVELTIEQHAEAHRLLFEKHGRWEDKMAWQLLSCLIKVDDARAAAAEEGKRRYYADRKRVEAAHEKMRATRKARGTKPWNTGKKCPSLSAAVKIQAKTKNFHCIGDHNRGKTFDDEHKQKLSARAQHRVRLTCAHCGKTCQPAMHARWHGEKCKMKSK